MNKTYHPDETTKKWYTHLIWISLNSIQQSDSHKVSISIKFRGHNFIPEPNKESVPTDSPYICSVVYHNTMMLYISLQFHEFQTIVILKLNHGRNKYSFLIKTWRIGLETPSQSEKNVCMNHSSMMNTFIYSCIKIPCDSYWESSLC